jgi:hypothetical protein
MLVRWSDAESAVDWTPTPTNSSGGFRLALGSRIMAVRNTRVETLIWTDCALYAMRYIGGSLVFGFTLLGTPISVAGPNAIAVVGGTAFWMGVDKFYMYNGTVNTLPCTLLSFLANSGNDSQMYQTYAGTNELFTEVTWFYCGEGSVDPDSYITYNYTENVWYFGTMERTAWIDSGLRPHPTAADSANNVLVYHEVNGVNDDESNTTPVAINAYIESSDFDLGDGHQFMFIWRALPDVSFEGSSAATTPSVTLTIKTRNSPGDDWISSTSQPSSSAVTRTARGSLYTSPIEEFTPEVWVRLRGRQASLRIESTDLGVMWQAGAIRLDIRPDGRR